jgi:hypothetical protein
MQYLLLVKNSVNGIRLRDESKDRPAVFTDVCSANHRLDFSWDCYVGEVAAELQQMALLCNDNL